jgi:predicted RNA-binding protein YlqC (UPF0109 family)
VSEIDQQFIEYVVKSLVGKPDAVHIDRRIDEKGVLLELTVDPEDLGRVIGKRGATAQSLRTLLRALGTKNDARYNLKIIDNGVGGHSSSNSSDSKTNDQTNDDSSSSTDQTKANANQTETAAIEDESSDVIVEPEIEIDETAAEDKTSERLRQAREELADLDDLDV